MQSAWISAENGSYTLDVRQLLEEQAWDNGLAEGSTYTIDLYYLANEAEFSPNGYRGSYLGAATYEYQAAKYGLFVGGTEVTSANAADVLGNGTVSYDPDSQTLTLSNAKVTKGEHEDAAIYYEGGDLAIVLEGNNVVTGPDDEPNSSSYSYSYGIGVEKQGNISISGDGALTVRGGKASTQYAGAFSYGIKADGNVEISGGTIIAEGGAVSAQSSTNSSNGICANQGIVISGGFVSATGGAAATQSYGLYAANGGVTLSGGELTAVGGQVNEGIMSKSLAISAYAGVTVKPSSGERISVVAGTSEADATALDGSPFETTTTITDLVDEQRYVKATASAIPAVQRYDIWVEGIQVTSANASDVLGDADEGATVSYDAQTNTLTLDHADLANTPESPQYPLQTAEPDLTIKLVGENTVSSSVENYPAVHIAPSQGEIKIIGDGAGAKLTVTSGVSEGIRVDWVDLVVQDCTVSVRTEAWGGLLVSGGKLAIQDAQVHVASSSDSDVAQGAYVLRGENGISITNGTVIASNGAPQANVIYSGAGIFIDGSTVTATGTAADAYPALYAAGNIDVKNGSEVTAKSAGMRGIFTEADMTISDNSKVTASGTTDEGMVVVGKLKVENSSLHASTSSDREMVVALVTEQLEAIASDVTLEGGLDLSAWYDLSTDNASLVIEPGAGELAEFKVDGQNRDGSAAAHFREEGANSPYDARSELTDAQINWLGAYRYVHIGEHVHAGGAATCARPAVCDDCGREYGAVDSDAHSFTHYVSNGDATCTGDGTETAACDNGCGATDTRTAVGSATGHSFVDGVCSVCGVRQPGQVTPPSDPTYPPEVEEGEGGTVEVTPARPHEGDEVTIAPDTDDGQVVDEIVVIGDDGEPIDVVDNGDGTWSFKQPKGSVTITVTFRCDGGGLCPTRGFLDVDQSQWYHAAADWAVENGALNGYGDGGELLGPLNTITRAEMAQVLWNQAGRPAAEADLSGFADVDASGWYADPVAWCLSEGIFRGYGDTFGTERAISREEVATVLWRLSGSPEADSDLSSFSDSASVSDYATGALAWAVESGVVTGKDDGTALDPQGPCTRAEVAAMLMRMSE
ncbi:MAG TPA: S-layer homology domain-containing protein [Candidatus Olsenella avicola]|nr:S-layer homology domain-containing protein [Candidatus Olsenella avicola]